MAAAYRDVDGIVLSIDGLQPEKGHETLSVVRELAQKRIWFGEALVSSSAGEVRRLLALARQWAERLGLRVRLWVSDKQDAFVSGIAAEFPGVPHRYCQNHFLRDVAHGVLAADSHVKARMRSKVRGLRAIERELLPAPTPTPTPTPPLVADDGPALTAAEPAVSAESPPPPPTDATAVVLDYCTAVKGILHDDQGGPLHPPGLWMAVNLQSVRESLQRNLEAKKRGAPSRR